jgi:hypothetical protein
MVSQTPYEQIKELLAGLNEGVPQGARRKVEGLEEDIDLPEVEAEEPEDAAEGWLFDSRRDYLEQLQHYKKR